MPVNMGARLRIRYSGTASARCWHADTMKFDGGDLVAFTALIANLGVTVTTLRHQRKSSHGGRLWEKRLQAYEEYADALMGDMRARHYRMSAPESPNLTALPEHETEARLSMLNRFHLYASDEARDAAADAYRAEEEWRSLESRYGHDPASVALAERVRSGFHADTLAERVMETLSREVVSGRPRRLRLRKGATQEQPGWMKKIAPKTPGDG